MVLFVIVAIISCIWLLKIFLSKNGDYLAKQGIPFVPPSQMGSLWDRLTLRTPIQISDQAAYKFLKSLGNKSLKFGGITELGRPALLLTDLDLLRQIGIKEFEHFTNRRPFGRKDDPTYINQMLFTMDDAEWKSMRAALTPIFTSGKLRRLYSIFAESSMKMAKYLKEEVKRSGNDIDIQRVSGMYAMNVIGSAAFGIDTMEFNREISAFSRMGNQFQNYFVGFMGGFRMLSAFAAPAIFKLFNFTFLDPGSVNFFAAMVKETIRRRESTGEMRNDFLQLMLEARAGTLKGDEDTNANKAGSAASPLFEKGEKLAKVSWTEDRIVAQSILFIFGGFDALEILLTFAAYELAINPDVQQRLYEEIREAERKHGELTHEVVNQMEYLDMVVSETLRKYPPPGRFDRVCTKDYNVPDTRLKIKKDTVVVVPLYAIHHDPEIYPDPEKFIPERFSTEEKAKRHSAAYIPFGIGPRLCIANRFAIAEGRAAIAYLVRDFLLEPTARTPIPIKFIVSINLKPERGLWIKVTPRK